MCVFKECQASSCVFKYGSGNLFPERRGGPQLVWYEHRCLCTAPTVVKAGWGWEALMNLGQNLALRFAEDQPGIYPPLICFLCETMNIVY